MYINNKLNEYLKGVSDVKKCIRGDNKWKGLIGKTKESIVDTKTIK